VTRADPLAPGTRASIFLPETILLTIWASNAASWAGPLTSSSAPTSADVDWIKVCRWQATTGAGGG
jgi:hypothetical protein